MLAVVAKSGSSASECLLKSVFSCEVLPEFTVLIYDWIYSFDLTLFSLGNQKLGGHICTLAPKVQRCHTPSSDTWKAELLLWQCHWDLSSCATRWFLLTPLSIGQSLQSHSLVMWEGILSLINIYKYIYLICSTIWSVAALPEQFFGVQT